MRSQRISQTENNQQKESKNEIRKKRIQRYKALRAKVKAQTQRTNCQNENQYKLTSKKQIKNVNEYKLASKQQKKSPTKRKTIENINDDQKEANKQSKPVNIPYYLRKNDFPNLQKIQSVCVNPYQKRKYRELLKMSERTEWEYRNKYIETKYGKNENNDYRSIFQSIDMNFGGIILKICIEMLLILHESWIGRMQIIATLVDQLCNSLISNDEFALKMCKFLYCVNLQFTDTRSLVIKEMKTQINKLCRNNPERFCFFAAYFLRQISPTWPIRIEAVREAGISLSQSIIVVCFPFDTDRLLLFTMFDLINSKHAAVRSKAAEFVHFMLHNVSLLEKVDATEKEEQLLNQVETTIKKLINDASSDARNKGYKLLFKFHKIAPNKFNEILQTLSTAKIKKFYAANLMNQENILSVTGDDVDEKERKYEYKQYSINDFDFNMRFKDTQCHPKDLEKRIKAIFVNRTTKLQNKRDRSVFFQDIITAERIGIHNNMPLLTLFNDIFVRCKMDTNNNKLFSVDYFINKYGLDKSLPNKFSNIFCSAIKQYQYMFPMINSYSKDDNLNYLIDDDNGHILINYIIGFLQFIEKQKNKLKNIKQVDLVIIPPNNSNNKNIQQPRLLKLFKRYKLNYAFSSELKDGSNDNIYDNFYQCFKALINRNIGRHIVFIIDGRTVNKSCIKIYGIIMKSTLKNPYNDIILYPEFHIANSKLVLFGKQSNINQKNKCKNKAKKGKNKNKSKIKSNNKPKKIQKNVCINGILSDIKMNTFALFCHICNSDCIRLYSMINDWFMRFLPSIDIIKMFKPSKLCIQDIPLLRDKQFEHVYEFITHQTLK